MRVNFLLLPCVFLSVTGVDVSSPLFSPLHQMVMQSRTRARPGVYTSPTTGKNLSTNSQKIQDEVEEEDTATTEVQPTTTEVVDGKSSTTSSATTSTATAFAPTTSTTTASAPIASTTTASSTTAFTTSASTTASTERVSVTKLQPVYIPTTTTANPTVIQTLNDIIEDTKSGVVDQKEPLEESQEIEVEKKETEAKVEPVSYYPILGSIGATVLLGGLAYYMYPQEDSIARSGLPDSQFYDHGAKIIHYSQLSPREIERLEGAQAYRVGKRSLPSNPKVENSFVNMVDNFFGSVVEIYRQYSKKRV